MTQKSALSVLLTQNQLLMLIKCSHIIQMLTLHSKPHWLLLVLWLTWCGDDVQYLKQTAFLLYSVGFSNAVVKLYLWPCWCAKNTQYKDGMDLYTAENHKVVFLVATILGQRFILQNADNSSLWMFCPQMIQKKQIRKHTNKRIKTSWRCKEESKIWRNILLERKQLCDSSGQYGKHPAECRYPAAGPEEMSPIFSYSQEYKCTSRTVLYYLPLSTECLQLHSESPKEWGEKGKTLNQLKKKRDRSSKKQRIFQIWQNSYKMFLSGVDSTIFLPKSRDHSCLEKGQVIDYSLRFQLAR